MTKQKIKATGPLQPPVEDALVEAEQVTEEAQAEEAPAGYPKEHLHLHDQLEGFLKQHKASLRPRAGKEEQDNAAFAARLAAASLRFEFK